MTALRAGDLGRSASQRPVRVKIDESSLPLTDTASIPLPIMRLSVVSWMLAANPTEWIAHAWKFRTCATSGRIPLLSEFFYSLVLPRIVIFPFQIRFVPDALVSADLFDSLLAQLTVSNIPELMGQNLEKSIFPRRGKLLFSTFKISTEHRRLFLSPYSSHASVITLLREIL